jgi:hypothetical protein
MPIPGRRVHWTLVVALLGLAACTAPNVVAPAPSTPESSESPPATRPPSATLPPPPTPLPCFTRGELAEMALNELAAWPALCFDSENGVRTEIDQAAAIATVRAFLQDPDRQMGFREVTTMSNAPGGRLPVLRLEDDRGISYLVAPVAGKVLEMSPGAYQPQTGGPSLLREDLQALAENLIRRELPAFDELRRGLDFQAGAKSGGVNFFRWEAPGPTTDGDLPPLAQVGITDSGEVFSYINTLYLLQ